MLVFPERMLVRVLLVMLCCACVVGQEAKQPEPKKPELIEWPKNCGPLIGWPGIRGLSMNLPPNYRISEAGEVSDVRSRWWIRASVAKKSFFDVRARTEARPDFDVQSRRSGWTNGRLAYLLGGVRVPEARWLLFIGGNSHTLILHARAVDDLASAEVRHILLTACWAQDSWTGPGMKFSLAQSLMTVSDIASTSSVVLRDKIRRWSDPLLFSVYSSASATMLPIGGGDGAWDMMQGLRLRLFEPIRVLSKRRIEVSGLAGGELVVEGTDGGVRKLLYHAVLTKNVMLMPWTKWEFFGVASLADRAEAVDVFRATLESFREK